MKSLDGGSTWVETGVQLFEGLDIQKIVPSTADPNTFLVAATSPATGKSTRAGVYLTTDGGASYTLVQKGEATDLIADPANAANNTKRFYAAIANVGVFISNDGGAHWAQSNGAGAGSLDSIKTNGADDDRDGSADNVGESVVNASVIKLAISASQSAGGTADTVYVGLVGQTNRAMAVFDSIDGGQNWTALPSFPGVAGMAANTLPDINPGKQGNIDFAMTADPANATNVFITGDRAVTAPFEGTVWRCDWSQPSATAWELVSSAGATATPGNRPSAPHADSRSMVFVKGGDILRSDDGGVYELLNPYTPASRQWISLNGDLQISEIYSVAYDPTRQTYFAGLQDIGVAEQPTTGSVKWTKRTSGDGGIVQIDGNRHYSSGNNLGFFEERTYNAAGTLTATNPAPKITGSTASPQQTIYSFGGLPFLTHYAVEHDTVTPGNPQRILIGSQYLYESFDDGATLLPDRRVDRCCWKRRSPAAPM